MKIQEPSITAANIAAVRAFESMRPSADRICHDPFARYFLSDDLSRSGKPSILLNEMISRWHRTVPGVCEAILARTRFVDGLLQEAIEKGLPQLVILGAGYDTRALRFERLRCGTVIFELDHPATQQVKRRRLRENRLRMPDGTVFIPCRFDREDFTAKLLAGGYDPGVITFFIWEGVSYYLSVVEVDRTLAFVAKRSPAGSALVFDHFPPSVVDGTSRLEEAAVLRQALKLMGEEITFGIDPDAVEDFLSVRGLTLQKRFFGEKIRNAYLAHIHRPATVSAMFHFVHATVNPVRQGNDSLHGEKGGTDA